ncbi:MAG: hypothetical protein K9K38_10455 [Rhodoferax sp.]|nr:hypothetical protein [Rhodoferax sp.]
MLIAQPDGFELTAEETLRPTPRQLAKVKRATPLAILQTFEASAQEQVAPHRFVSNLQAMNLPLEIVSMLDDLTEVLGTVAKAWALVLQWLAERLADQITLSGQSERLLRQALKGEETEVLHALKLTWAARIDAFMNQEFVSDGGTNDCEDDEIPELMCNQAD